MAVAEAKASTVRDAVDRGEPQPTRCLDPEVGPACEHRPVDQVPLVGRDLAGTLAADLDDQPRLVGHPGDILVPQAQGQTDRVEPRPGLALLAGTRTRTDPWGMAGDTTGSAVQAQGPSGREGVHRDPDRG